MGQSIAKQPNGLYCIFSSISDNISYYNLTIKDLEGVYGSTDVDRYIRMSNRTYDEMMETISEIHGKKEVIEIEQGILDDYEVSMNRNNIRDKVGDMYKEDPETKDPEHSVIMSYNSDYVEWLEKKVLKLTK